MDQSEDREEGVPPSKTTLCGEHESQTKAQRNQPGHKPETERGPEPGSGSDSGSSCMSLKSDQHKDEPIDFKVRQASAAESFGRMSFPYIPASKYFPRLSNPLNILEEKKFKSKLSDPWSFLSGSLTALRMFLRPDLPQTENRNVALKRAQSLDTGLSFHREPGAAAAESVALKRAQSMDTGLSFHKGPGAVAQRMEPVGVQWFRPGLRKYSCQLTINTNTVHTNLKLSDNNRKVTFVWEVQSYPDHPDRFDFDPQLLCRNGLTGRCYWEVEWRGHVFISVSYRRIRRKGGILECLFGNNDQSWSLYCSDDGPSSVRHKSIQTSISSSSVSNRVAVYVDHPAGTLSFYRVSSDTLLHLHTFNTTFTEPLYAGFRLWFLGSSVCLC
ncbi:uncharacterized protein LOC106632608 isoform X2 [Haplochromis burtoni]|uniref:uncharacterized protein LOC106632608 isoform X2 n=1 Tax=Haplochromis burtoni TaxID=8153 RepID=UPI001C2D947D|nr:uncharacterized protein LOC106632608 isoform X2 [Haplochromis burtoni]